MAHLWDAELAVTTCQAKKLIESQFPELIPADIKILDYGFDNTVMKVNRDWVFRFPRREIAVRLLETEGELLPLLEESGPNLHIPFPSITRNPLLYINGRFSVIDLWKELFRHGQTCCERRELRLSKWPGFLKSFTERVWQKQRNVASLMTSFLGWMLKNGSPFWKKTRKKSRSSTFFIKWGI